MKHQPRQSSSHWRTVELIARRLMRDRIARASFDFPGMHPVPVQADAASEGLE